MEVVLSENAMFMADCILSDSRSLFGEKSISENAGKNRDCIEKYRMVCKIRLT